MKRERVAVSILFEDGCESQPAIAKSRRLLDPR